MFLVTQLCLTLYDPMECSLTGSFAHEDSPGKNTGVGCHALPKGNGSDLFIHVSQDLEHGWHPQAFTVYVTNETRSC